MLLVEHCISYLYPVLKDMSTLERELGMPEDSWQILTEETKRAIGRRFLQDAETCIIVGATPLEKKRIAEIYGNLQPAWFLDENPECEGLPIRFTPIRE